MSKPRILISTDIGGSDPDDIQSMVHALLYADKFKLEGLVSTPTKHGGRTADIHKVIDAYATDYAKLKTWSSDYPTPEYLRSITKQGNVSVAPSQGWSTATDGSKAIIKAAHASSEPLWVLTWGAMTDVAQALHDDPSIASKIKLYSIGGWNTQQDPHARNYVYNNFKDLWFIENDSTLRGMYIDESGNFRNDWRMSDAQGHGALGEHFYKAMPWMLKMGDTPSLLYLIDNAPDSDPTAASWGGNFAKTGHGPNFWTDRTDAAVRIGSYDGTKTIQPYQDAIYADFAKHLDRAKSYNPNAGSADSGGTSTGGTSTGGTSTGGTSGGNPVTAVDDDMWKTAVNQTLWQNARYLTYNDKGADGSLKVTAVASKSAAGGTISFSSDGTIKFTPLAGWQGKDAVQYTVSDADGSTDTGVFYVQVGTGGPVMSADSTGGTSTGGTSTGGTSTGGTSTGGTSTGGTSTGETSTGGTGNPVIAVDDDMWKVGKDQTMWQNARYLTGNDKGADGGLKVTAVASKSAAGGSIEFGSDGTIKFKPLAGWQGKDAVQYAVSDADGSTDTGVFYVQVGTGGPVMSADSTGGTSTGSTSTGGTSTGGTSTGGTSTGSTSSGSTSSGGTGNPVDANNDQWNAKSGQTLWFNSRYLLDNDKAADGGLSVKSIAATTAKGGIVNWDAATGTTTYRAKAGFTGKDYVEYVAVDADGSSDTAFINFDVLIA